MPSRRRERELLDRLWGRVAPLPPPDPPHPAGGRPRAGDQACCAGSGYQPGSGIRWGAMPARSPSGVTRWRRHRDWTRAGVWKVVLAGLAAAGPLDTTERLPGATFAESRGGGPVSAVPGAASA